jgi:hypothetical protein
MSDTPLAASKRRAEAHHARAPAELHYVRANGHQFFDGLVKGCHALFIGQHLPVVVQWNVLTQVCVVIDPMKRRDLEGGGGVGFGTRICVRGLHGVAHQRANLGPRPEMRESLGKRAKRAAARVSDLALRQNPDIGAGFEGGACRKRQATLDTARRPCTL